MIKLIAAVSENGVIGLDGRLPWYMPEDLKRFRKLTLGTSVVMGRKTLESLDGKPLPSRKNYVISSTLDENHMSGVSICRDVESALEMTNRDCFVIGGENVYRQTIDLADMLYITRVWGEYRGDSYFPHIDDNIWEVVSNEPSRGCNYLIYRKK